MTTYRVLLAALIAVAVLGCDLVDPERPTPYPDTRVYGNLLEVIEPADAGEPWVARLRVGVPRALSRAEEAEGEPAPEVEDGLVAEVAVDADAVVVADGRFTSLDAIPPGTEVVVVPVLGTTRMVGSSTVLVQARYLLDFETFASWQLPKLELPGVEREPPRTDPGRVNSDGMESSPVPVGDGSVLYFSARLRRGPEGSLLGAPRPGMAPEGDGEGPLERTYRTELGDDGWSPPEPVELAGLADGARAAVSWVAADETRALVTVTAPGEPPWVGVSTRPAARGEWGAPQRIDALGTGDARDGVYLAGSTTKLVFVSSRDGGVQSDLYLHDPGMERSPLPLEPQLNSVGDEWSPRIGPSGELFFMRDERQLLRSGGKLHEVRLPGPQRVVVTEAAPTADGRWVFLCIPRFRPVELDQDIWVAPRLGDGRLGAPVEVDDWRSEPAG